MLLNNIKAKLAPEKKGGLLYFSHILLLIVFICGCTTPKVPFCPKVDYVPPCECLVKKPSPFCLLSKEELCQDFSKELKVGYAFAYECDYYRAITAFKRALILMPADCYCDRRDEIEYDILLCYYLGQKYEDVLKTFAGSCLKDHLSPSFKAFHDLLIILYDSAYKCQECCYANEILSRLKALYPCTGKKIEIGEKIGNGHLLEASKVDGAPQYLYKLYSGYQVDKKSIKKAEMLNAIFPGAGYLYVGQNNTAITAFLVNSLFIWASYQFFHKGYIAAGIVTASLEGGWYFGGIYGGGRAAAEYNEKKYEQYGRKAMDQGHYYPILQLHYVF